MGKQSFVVYDAWGNMVNALPDEEAGRLFKALFAYRAGQPQTLSPALSGILSFMSGEIEKDNAKYDAMCERQRQRVLKRWSKEREDDTTVYHGIPANTIKDKDKDIKKKNIKKKSWTQTVESRPYDFEALEAQVIGVQNYDAV